MQPTQALIDRLAALLATDTTTIAPAADAVHIHLAIAPFTPSLELTVGGLTEATFTGYAPLDAGTGAQQHFVDPATTEWVIQLLEPAGGWTWLCTGGTGLPQTIYGIYATDDADAVLYGAELLDAPITISASGQGVTVGQVRFNLSNDALT